MSRLIANAAFALAPTTSSYLAHAGGYITRGDVAVALPAARLDAGRGPALCADDEGPPETVEIDLVAPVAPGDRLLVHAAAVIARLPEAAPR